MHRRRWFGVLWMAVCLGGGLVYAQSLKVIQMKDGSVLNGNVLGLAEGIYTIETSNLGKISIKEEDVLSIVAASQPSVPQIAAPQPMNLKGQAFPSRDNMMEQAKQLMANPAMAQDIKNLANNEDIRTILSDPQFINDLMTMDPQKLQNNEKMNKLLQNPQMQELIQKIYQDFATQSQPK